MTNDEKGGFRVWLRRRPWIWIVLLFVFAIAVNGVMVVIALMNQPTSVR